jgi:hypothetical protein
MALAEEIRCLEGRGSRLCLPGELSSPSLSLGTTPVCYGKPGLTEADWTDTWSCDLGQERAGEGLSAGAGGGQMLLPGARREAGWGESTFWLFLWNLFARGQNTLSASDEAGTWPGPQNLPVEQFLSAFRTGQGKP